LFQGSLFRHHHQHHHKLHHKKDAVALQQSNEFKESTWQYQGDDDWEKDLMTDDDDKLAETMKKYAKDEKVKGSRIIPKMQSGSEFSEDYPNDDGTGAVVGGGGPSKPDAPLNVTNSSIDPMDVPAIKDAIADAVSLERSHAKVEYSQKSVKDLKKELEKAQGKAKKAHELVKKQKEKMKDQKKVLIQAKGAFDSSVKELSKCHKLEDKLAVDTTITQQAKAALQARLEMLEKQLSKAIERAATTSIRIEPDDTAAKEVKKKLDDAIKDQENLEKTEKAAKAALRNATTVLHDKNQTLVQAMNNSNNTLKERREEALWKAKQKIRY